MSQQHAESGISISAEDLCALGEACFQKKLYDEAEEHLGGTLELNPQNHRALYLMGEIAARQDETLEALGFYMLAIKENPAELFYKQRFIIFTHRLYALMQFNPLFKATLLACLQTPDLSCDDLPAGWYATFCTDPSFKSVYRLKRRGWLFPFGRVDSVPSFDRQRFSKCRDFSPLLDPFFLSALERIVVCNSLFEDFLTCLRRALLDDLKVEKKKFGADFIPLAAALAHYCFYTEYIFNISAEEQACVKELGTRLGAGTAGEMETAVYACYAPLYALDAAQKIEKQCISSPMLGRLISLQITDYLELLKKRESIVAITSISEGVSTAVREQYEEFPYPCWKLPEFGQALDYYATLPHGAEILVAGGGTGRQASSIARVLPHTEILSIDLSLTSLAYGALRAEALGIKNIAFKQADILQLSPEGRKYDLIACGGVLHHMDDPIQGWRVLTRLLKPGGLMHIALYSEAARATVVKSRAVIAEKKIPATAEGMRDFRTNVVKYVGESTALSLQKTTDYYYMSMFKDLLFHVQEHRFTLPQIRDILHTLDLEFLKFSLSERVQHAYRAQFPGDPSMTNLDNWETFEKNHPDAFQSMYQFWCRVK